MLMMDRLKNGVPACLPVTLGACWMMSRKGAKASFQFLSWPPAAAAHFPFARCEKAFHFFSFESPVWV